MHTSRTSPPFPRPFLPILVQLVAVALFLCTVWFVGRTYPGEPFDRSGSERTKIRRADAGRAGIDTTVILQSIAGTPAARELRSRATAYANASDALQRQADSLIAGASAKGDAARAAADSVRAAGLKRTASQYRDRANGLDSTLAVREAAIARRAAKHQVWVYVAAADLLMATFAGLVAMVLLLQKVPRRWIPAVVAALLAAAVVAGILFTRTWYDYDSRTYDLARMALGDDVVGLARFSDALHIVVVVIALLGAVFAWSGLPWPNRALGPGGTADAARDIRQAMRLNQLGLYVGATMLVVYVAAVSSLFDWTLAYVNPAPKTVFDEVRALANSAVTARSLLASGLLLSMYGTALILVRVMRSYVAERVHPDGSIEEQEAWVQAQGLSGGDWIQPLKPLAAVLAPVVTGVVAQILQNLS